MKIEEARRQLRHSDAARLFGEEEDGTAGKGRRCAGRGDFGGGVVLLGFGSKHQAS